MTISGPSNILHVEFSAVTTVGPEGNKLVLFSSDVASETLGITEEEVTSTVVSLAATGEGVVKLSNVSEVNAWISVGTNPDVDDSRKRRLLKAGQDITLSCPVNAKAAIKRV